MISELLERMLGGDKRALGRLITLVENGSPEVPQIMSEIHQRTGRAYSVGLTGPPGAGKSTLADRLILLYREIGLKVSAILADPSSPFTGGAILGDRIRMQNHSLDDGVFIRSFSTRGSRGGLPMVTRDVMNLLDAFGSDIVLLETIGVGQTELDIIEVADTTIVILVPEAGDTIQTMKAGLMEIADIFVVNKADREGADRIVEEIRSMIALKNKKDGEWNPPVIKTSASKNEGIDELTDEINKHRKWLDTSKKRAGIKEALRKSELEEILLLKIKSRIKRAAEKGHLKEYFEKVQLNKISPYTAADKIIEEKKLSKILDGD